MVKNFFLQNECIFKKNLYFLCKTNIFCIKIYVSNNIYFLHFHLYFSVKKSFFQKHFFSVNNAYFAKNYIFFEIFFQEEIFFFRLSFAANEQP